VPKLWLCEWPDGEMYFQETKPTETYNDFPIRHVQVEINNSLYRQILAAETKYHKFQDAMENWLEEAEAGRLKRISDGR
jgi:hypothetical protein